MSKNEEPTANTPADNEDTLSTTQPEVEVYREALQYIFGNMDLSFWRRVLDEKLTPPWPLPHHVDAMSLPTPSPANTQPLAYTHKPVGGRIHPITPREYAWLRESGGGEGFRPLVYGDTPSPAEAQPVGYLSKGTQDGEEAIGFRAGPGYRAYALPDGDTPLYDHPPPSAPVGDALRIAYRHLDMASMRVSHCKDAAAIEAALAQQPPAEAYSRQRIAWELERIAMGDGFYGKALRLAKDLPEATPQIRSLLDRWATGRQEGVSDRADLSAFALTIYGDTARPSAPVGVDADEDDELVEQIARAIAKDGFSRPWEDFHDLNAHDTDQADLRDYARAALSVLAQQPTSRIFVERSAAEKPLREALSYVGQRSDGNLMQLAYRCELWMRESHDLIQNPVPVQPAAVSEVTRQLIERDHKGREKYGTTLDRRDLSVADWLQHMSEELLDAAGYALAAKREVQQFEPEDGDLTVAYMAGHYDGKKKYQQPADEDMEDLRRLKWLATNELIVRRLSDSGQWMVVTGDQHPAVDGGEYDTWRKAIDEAIAAQQGGRGDD